MSDVSHSSPRPVRVSPEFPPAQTYEGSLNVPYKEVALRSAGVVGRGSMWLVKSIFWFVLTSSAVYFFFGETTITATLDDKSTAAQVFVNDEYVGETPQKLRLPFDAVTVVIIQPDGVDTNESEFIYKSKGGLYNVGSEVAADFTSIDPNDQ